MPESTAFDQSRVARGLAIKTTYKQQGSAGTRYRPVKVALFAQGADGTTYATTKRQVFSAAEGGTLYGFDSPIYQALLSLFPANGDGVGNIPVTVYPLAAPVGAQAAGSIAPTGTMTKSQTFYIKVNNRLSLPITMLTGETVADFITKAIAALNGVVGMPGTASDGTTNVTFTAGWTGATGNDIYLEIVEPDDSELTFAIVQPTGGSGVASVTAALAQVGGVWETHAINQNLLTETTTLDEFATFDEGRWLPKVRKPFAGVFTGTNEATLATVTAITNARKTDRTNVIATNAASHDLPIVIAADQVKRIAVRAASNPPHDYGALDCPRLTPAVDNLQWEPQDLNQLAVVAGVSTVEVVDGVVEISDIVTCSHPTGEDPPPYRYVCDKEKIATMIYNCELVFGRADWKGGPPLIPNNQATKNTATKKPMMGTAELHGIIDRAAMDSIISDPDFAKANSSMTISTVNPKRVDAKLVFKLAGNANVISLDLEFGFHYGAATVI